MEFLVSNAQETTRRRPAGRVVGCLVCLAVLAALETWAGAALGAGCEPTPPDAEGPFYRPGAPERESTGAGLTVRGRVLGAPDCRPLPEARVEWWHAGPSGEYDEAHRGSRRTDRQGGYLFTTDSPGKYPGRPLHIHFKVFAPGYRDLTTQRYLRRGEKDVTFDIVLSPRK